MNGRPRETTFSEEEKARIFSACTRFVPYHGPSRPAQVLSELASLATSEDRADHYGTGKIIEDFEREVAELLGHESAVFMPSGTMAQVIAMRVWCDRKQNHKFAMHPTSHVEKREEHAYRHLHSLDAELLGESTRRLSIEDLRCSSGRFSAVLVELPQRELGGVLPPWNELEQMSQFCRERGIMFHLDGARLWESAPYYSKTPRDIAALFDSVYVSFYKGLGGLVGAMLLGPRDFIAEAKIWQKRHGGQLIQLYPYVLSARHGLRERGPRMPLYHAKAKAIAAALSKIPGITVGPEEPHTNMMHLKFARERTRLEAAFTRIARDEKISVLSRVLPTADPGVCWAELSVGDATLQLETPLIADLFRRALADSN